MRQIMRINIRASILFKFHTMWCGCMQQGVAIDFPSSECAAILNFIALKSNCKEGTVLPFSVVQRIRRVPQNASLQFSRHSEETLKRWVFPWRGFWPCSGGNDSRFCGTTSTFARANLPVFYWLLSFNKQRTLTCWPPHWIPATLRTAMSTSNYWRHPPNIHEVQVHTF